MGKRLGARVACLVLTVIAAGCTVHKTEAPPLSGPSEFAISVVVTATPDTLTQDGASQSAIVVSVRDATGRPLPNQPLRIDMAVNGILQDFGRLSARAIVTGTDGKANAIFTAPPPPPPTAGGTGTRVTIVATLTSTNAQAAVAGSSSAEIRLMPPGVILPPAATPTASFTFSPTVVAANSPVQFDASASSPGQGASEITSFSWNFGDGTPTVAGKTVTHTFTSPNTFNVTLTVVNDRGLSASTTQAVTVGTATLPTPSFTFSPAAPGINETVFFNAGTSTPGAGHTITSYRWTFGDGATGSGVTTSHAYATAGTFAVQLTVTDEAGQSATSPATNIQVGNPPAPTANFTFSPQTPAANQTVVFDASTSTTAQGQTITDYAWNFGDSTPIVHTASKTIAHTFGIAGTFSVSLTVTDSAGRTNAVSKSIVVSSSGGPTAAFTFTPSPASVNQEVSFKASASTPSGTGTRIVNFQWDFGDGSPQVGTSVATAGHTYQRAGTFAVKLTVTDDAGQTASTSRTIVVQ